MKVSPVEDGVKFPVVDEVIFEELDIGGGSRTPTAAHVALVKLYIAVTDLVTDMTK